MIPTTHKHGHPHTTQFDTQDSQALPLQNILRTASAITTGTYMDVINNDEFDVGQSLAYVGVWRCGDTCDATV